MFPTVWVGGGRTFSQHEDKSSSKHKNAIRNPCDMTNDALNRAFKEDQKQKMHIGEALRAMPPTWIVDDWSGNSRLEESGRGIRSRMESLNSMLFWGHLEVSLCHSGVILVHCGVILGLIWDHSGVNLGPFWGQFRAILEPFWGHSTSKSIIWQV